MIIEELKLISIERVYQGGSTNPLLITAENSKGEIDAYIVKLFKSKFVKENFVTAKEIIVVELAKDFDLPVPDYGIINFDHSLLKDFYDKSFINEIDLGYKFCSKFQEGYIIYSKTLIRDNFLKDYEIENVFGFDNLIINIDRGGFRNKPNLLVSNENFLLIDHEQALTFLDIHSDELAIDNKSKINAYFFKNHLFYENLRKRKDKDVIFADFLESLRFLNLNILVELYANFEKFNIDCGNRNNCFLYFEWCKSNLNYIDKLLRDRLS